RAPARRTSRRVGVRGIRSQLPARQFHRHYASPTVGAATGRPRKPARSANDSRFVLLLPMSGCLRVRRLSNNLCGQPNSESGVTMCSRLPLSCTLAILIVDPTLADDKPSPLADADKKELTELLKDVLFDPTGAQRVRVPVTVYSPWGGSHTIARTGWLVRGKEGAKDRVYFADGHTVVAPAEKDIKKLDFITECRERYPENAGPKDDREVFRQMRQAAAGGEDDPDLAIAAWLHKLGHDDMAGRALAAARAEAKARERDGKGPIPKDVLRGELAWRAFGGLVHGYVNRADDEALAHGER